MVHFHGADERIGTLCGRRSFGGALKQSTPRTTGFDSPVLEWHSFHFSKLPAKDLFVKLNRALWIVGLDFEIGGPRISPCYASDDPLMPRVDTPRGSSLALDNCRSNLPASRSWNK